MVEAYRRQRAAFESAVGLMQPSAERVVIPFADRSLHGYVFRAADGNQRRPTLIITGGYDSTAEEAYFFSGAAAVARGYTCLVFDGPGQGAAIIEDGIVFRPIGSRSSAPWSTSPSAGRKSIRLASRCWALVSAVTSLPCGKR